MRRILMILSFIIMFEAVHTSSRELACPVYVVADNELTKIGTQLHVNSWRETTYFPSSEHMRLKMLGKSNHHW